MRRSLASLSLLFLIAGFSCQRTVDLKERLNEYLSATERLSRQFEFNLETEGSDIGITVVGMVEDSFRYRAIMSMDDANVIEQIVRDDAMAVRVIDPSKLGLLAQGAAPSSQVIIDALNGGQWVVDPSGAPPLRRNPDEARSELDPVTEAITVPVYIRQAIEQASFINEWREEDIAPAYRPSEQNFRPADDETGERRFDLVRPVLPTGSSGLEQLPGPAHFRRMAMYVIDDRVVEVQEQIDIEGHFEVQKAREENKERLLDLIEAVKAQQGVQAVIPRTMSIKFTGFSVPGDPTLLPEAIRASLRGIFDKTAAAEIPAATEQASPQPSPTPTS